MTDTGQANRQNYDHLAPLFDELVDPGVSEERRKQVRDELAAGYLPVSQHIALRFRGRGQPDDDLRQVAAVGLIKAIDRFDPVRGTDFLSFAVPTITGEVRRHFRDAGWSVHVPRRLKELHQLVNGAVTELSNELNRAPRPSEIAEKLGISIDEVHEGMDVGAAYAPSPLDGGSGNGDDDESGPKLTDRLGADDTGLTDIENQVTLHPALAQLPERQRAIVLMRFFGDMTQTQIAKQINISQMHVSRLLARSLDQLRNALTDDELPKGD
jgi:RNA polymerase sigma-B factor